MSDWLGLIIDERHEATINSFESVPALFGVGDNVPDEWYPPLVVENQGRTNSCAGHSLALAFAHSNYMETLEVKRFSRRFAYITSQIEGGFVGRDQGTSITSTLDASVKYGCCLEEDCQFTERYSTTIDARAYDVAAKHKHLGDRRYDCRDYGTAINWLTDRRCIVIGTKWMENQNWCSGIEDLKTGSGGRFQGYHARLLIGFRKHDGALCPVVQNSHSKNWGMNGRAIITPDLWDWWRKDPNFFALGFGRINEVQPHRLSWTISNVGDRC